MAKKTKEVAKNYASMAPEELEAARQRTIAEINKRGGNAPNYQARLKELDALIQGGGAGPTEANVVAETGGIKNAKTAVDAEITAADFEAKKNINYNNPTEVTDLGTKTVTFDENGNPVVTETLSDDQQGILDAGEEITKFGQDIARQRLQSGNYGNAWTPETNQRTSTGNLLSDRARYEDAIFAKYTRDIDNQEARQSEEARSRLLNMGIPFSADPNSRYQQEMRAITDRFDTQREYARQNAIQGGLAEHQGNVGIEEQIIANQFGQSQGARNQNLNEIGALQNMGTGLMMPNFNSYQGANYDPANPLESFMAFEGLKDVDKQRALEKALAQMAIRARGAGGGGTPADPEKDIFMTGGPPGL